MVDLVKAQVTNTRKIRIHNMVSQAAWHFKSVIEDKQKRDEESGVTYDCMACATMLAFTWEAYLNFFGDELIGDYWKGEQPLNKKSTSSFRSSRLRLTGPSVPISLFRP